MDTDLFGPNKVVSLSGKVYVFVIVDDYSRYTWVIFLAHKDEAHISSLNFVNVFKMNFFFTIVNIRTDRKREFENKDIKLFCNKNNFCHNFYYNLSK